MASLRELPTKNGDILRLLDVLFDVKKIHKEVVEKLDVLSVNSKVTDAKKINKRLSMESSYEREYPTTASKVSLF